jgi:hypothetical protein
MVAVGVRVAVGVAVGVGVGVGAAAITETPSPNALTRATTAMRAIEAVREWPLPVSGRNPRIASTAIPATTAQVR